MRIAACSIAWQGAGRWDAEPRPEVPAEIAAARIRAAGADGVEFWEPHVRSADPLRLRQELAGTPVAMVSGYYDFTGSLEAATASLAHAHAVLARAAAIGAQGIRIFTGKKRGGDADAAIWERTVGMLRELSDAAGPVILAAELHDWNLMDTEANALRLVQAVDRPNFGLILHPERLADDLAGGIVRLAPWIRHVHVRTTAAGGLDPAVAWEVVVESLPRTCFAGWWSIEHFAPGPDRCVPAGITALRRLASAGGLGR